MWKVKLILKIAYYWDVFYTILDNFQLRIYVKLKNKARDLLAEHYKLDKREKLQRESYEDWDSIK